MIGQYTEFNCLLAHDWTVKEERMVTGPVVEMKIWIYWSESNSLIYFYIHCTFVFLNKNWKNYSTEQNFTGLRPEDQCTSWGLQDRNSKQDTFCINVIRYWCITKNCNKIQQTSNLIILNGLYLVDLNRYKWGANNNWKQIIYLKEKKNKTWPSSILIS